MTKGTYIAVSTGILLAGHLSVRTKKIIEDADVVFSLMPHPIAESWLETVSKEHISLQPYYGEGKYRKETYEEMIEAILAEVRKGRSVCGAFYGHAGVFSWVPHESIKRAKNEGYFAYMEPGISAEACLYSDLLIDPGSCGVQSYEATQFLYYGHKPNKYSYLLLWQIALAGDTTAKTFKTDPEKVKHLTEHLKQWYDSEHEVILYEAAFLPIDKVRSEKVALKDVHKVELKLHTTLVIPPVDAISFDRELAEELAQKSSK
ncbi:SAM-dependent methyltransferase [Kangiella marina]|uniref:SAM-dependent methyltransferase n=1 Tax=Kangiella marina TaxID=1079178 RepID=A0ABP8IIL6_9GAMM